jgi:hypothetical protein
LVPGIIQAVVARTYPDRKSRIGALAEVAFGMVTPGPVVRREQAVRFCHRQT